MVARLLRLLTAKPYLFDSLAFFVLFVRVKLRLELENLALLGGREVLGVCHRDHYPLMIPMMTMITLIRGNFTLNFQTPAVGVEDDFSAD